MKLFKTEAIVLKSKDLLHKDITVTFFTKEYGKLFVIAKGIKKMTSRRAPHIQTSNLVNVILHKSEDRYYLQSSELISGFTQLKELEEKVNILYTVFFILDRLLPIEQKEEPVYNRTKILLIELTKSNKTSYLPLLTTYLNDILELLGYLHEVKPLPQLIRIIEEQINEKVPLANAN